MNRNWPLKLQTSFLVGLVCSLLLCSALPPIDVRDFRTLLAPIGLETFTAIGRCGHSIIWNQKERNAWYLVEVAFNETKCYKLALPFSHKAFIEFRRMTNNLHTRVWHISFEDLIYSMAIEKYVCDRSLWIWVCTSTHTHFSCRTAATL